ncbi:MAG: ABC transporter permease [Chloroflexi bacterium]|nr:ABC transporter permease [Chloroflexota bacterium]
MKKPITLWQKFGRFLFDNKVILVFALIVFGAIIASGSPISFVVDGIFSRIGRNMFTVLALIIPVVAGMGLNFGIVIGAIAAQIALFCVVYWGLGGIGGMLLAALITTPLAAFFGWLGGKLFNRMKGAEMIAGLILGYFADGLYQLLFLVLIGGVIPVKETSHLIIAGGVGVKNTIDLTGNLKYTIDDVTLLQMLLVALIIAVIMLLVKLVLRGMHKLELTRRDFIPVAVLGVLFGVGQVPFVKEMLSFSKIKLLPAVTIAVIGVILWQVYKIIKKRSQPGFNLTKTIGVIVLAAVLYALTYIKSIEFVLKMVSFPILPFVLIALIWLFNLKILDTRIGQNMRTVGQSQTVATASGIDVDRTRVIAMIISTVLASWGQLIYLQNMGTFSTYGAHLQIGQFAIAALLVGGASVQKATNRQALIGVILFHALFIVAPEAGKMLFGNAMIGEYFRVFVSYGVIALSLAMHAWKLAKKPDDESLPLIGESDSASNHTPVDQRA